MGYRVVCLLLLVVGLLLGSVANAQRTQGTISGTVSDPSGAVIPNAEVTATMEGTGVKRTVMTNGSGFYTITNLDPGTYAVSVKMAGFKGVDRRGVTLHVADDITVPFTLEIGLPTEVMTVTAEATQVELRNGEVSNTINSQQIEELPLNGRSFVGLTLLVPGAAPSDTQNSRFTGLLGGVDISQSGSPANANSYTVDGADNVDHGSGRTILTYPSVDSIEEFKIQRNSMAADNASQSGAVINVVTKGGSNDFHGSVYEFFRNDKLDANNFFLNAAAKPKGELRYNNWGYTFSGPVKKNKLFFFWSEEWRREVRGVTRRSEVPTDLERQGNFSDWASRHAVDSNFNQPSDPFTGSPFPADTIQSGRLSQAGLDFMQLFPHENTPGQLNNWVAAVPTHLPTRQEQARADFNVTQKHSIMFRWTSDHWYNPAPNFGSDGGLWGDTGFPTVDSSWSQPSTTMSARLTSSFSASKVNTFQFSYSNNRIFITEGLGKNINDTLNADIPSAFPNSPTDRAHPIFWGTQMQGLGNSLWNNAPWDNAHDIYSWKDDFSIVKGNHNHRVGFFYGYDKKDEDCCGASVTSPQFWGPQAVPGGAGKGGGWGNANAPGNGGIVTGNGISDMLLAGTYFGANQQSSQPRSKVRWADIELYYADTWRATKRLSLDYGVRWSLLPPSIQADNLIGNFVPSLYDPAEGASSTNGMIYPSALRLPSQGITGGSANLRGIDVGRALRKSSYDTIAPRFGFAYDLTGSGKWALRGGFGTFFGRADLSQPIGELLLNPPFNASVNFGTGRPLDTLPAALIPASGVGVAQNAADTNWRTQTSYQWNLTVEHELFQDTKLEVAYVGNRGTHLPINWDLNLVAPANRQTFALDSFTGQTDAANKLRELFPLSGTNSLFFLTNGGSSSYHALQVYLTKRFSHNFQFGGAYTYSKNISTTGLDCCQSNANARIADPFNFSYNRGPADFDRPHIVSLNSVYKLPSLQKQSAPVRMIFGNWEGTAIYSYATGIPLTVTISGPNLLGITTVRPMLVGDPNGPHNVNGGWLNPAAFEVPQLGQLGDAGVGIVHGPPTNNADLAIYKNFPIGEKKAVQFRFETFNTFNHTQFYATSISTNYVVNGLTTLQDPTKSFDATTNPYTSQFTGCSGQPIFPNCLANAQFGLPTRAKDGREVQVALKFTF